MKRFSVMAMLAIAIFVLANAAGQAEIIVDGYYHLGEADSGAANGVAGNATTVDSSGNAKDLTKGGTTTYSSSVGSTAVAHTGSTLSMDFGTDGGNSYSRANNLTANQDNFGIEGWFKVADTTNQGLAFNGIDGGNGFGLVVQYGQIYGAYPGVAWVYTGFTPTANEWFYVAMVRDSGTTTMYVNNTTPIGDNLSAPQAPGAQFSIGGAAADPLKGWADEVRVFHFVEGCFSTDDLLISATVPEPSTLLALMTGLLGLLAYAWRRRK